MTISPVQILLLLLVVLVLFGAKRLPDTARSIGRSMRIFKSEMDEMRNDSDTTPGQPEIAATPTDSAQQTQVKADNAQQQNPQGS